MVYKGIIKLKKEDKEYYNAGLEDIENGYEDDFICIGSCTFKNGVNICIDLCSGDCNYYLQYVLYYEDGGEEYDTIDYGLSDTIEIEDGENNTYIIDFIEE